MRLGIVGPAGDSQAFPFDRGGTPTASPAEFAATYVRVGGSQLGLRRFDVSMAGSVSSPSFSTIVTRFKFRITRLPTSETGIWSNTATLEAGPPCVLSCTTTGLIRVYNQGNQVTFAQLLGDVGTVVLNDWNTITITATTRNDATGRLPFISVVRNAEIGADGSFSQTLAVPGSNSGLQANGNAINGNALAMTQGAHTPSLDWQVCDWIADDTAAGADARVTTLPMVANGTYQEFGVSGIADWRARNMWPFGSAFPATLANFAIRSNTLGQRQSYRVQSFSAAGVTGSILGAVAHFFLGAGGNGATFTAPTFIVRRTTSGGTTTETTLTLWTIPLNSWINVRIDSASGWSATDTIEIGLQNGANQGLSIHAMALSVEHTSTYVEPSNTDFLLRNSTWTGNGTVQTLTAPDSMRPDLILWWPTSATNVGGIWWRGLAGSQKLGTSTNTGPTRTDFQVDGTSIHLIGAETDGPNVSGRAYSALFLADATWRMLVTGSLYQDGNASWDNRDITTTTLEGDAFEPEYLIGVHQTPSTGTNLMNRNGGNTGDQSSFFAANSAAIANWFQSVAASGFQIGTAMASASQPFGWAALRSGFIGAAFMSFSTYVGDGTGNRAITLNMPGFTPSWLILQPSGTSGAQRIIRTPGSSSGRAMDNGATVANTFVSAGVNTVTVGSALNASGVTYAVWALAEGTDAEPEPEPDPDPYPGDPLPDPGPVPSTLNATLLRMRRLRRCAHLSQEEFRIYYHRLQVDMETGVGLEGAEQVGSAPQVMLRWSDDGGMTWSNEHWISAGRIGNWSRRVLWDRLGHGRDRVFELIVSDPVAWRIVDAFLQTTPGSS